MNIQKRVENLSIEGRWYIYDLLDFFEFKQQITGVFDMKSQETCNGLDTSFKALLKELDKHPVERRMKIFNGLLDWRDKINAAATEAEKKQLLSRLPPVEDLI